eukprot:g46094.t1
MQWTSTHGLQFGATSYQAQNQRVKPCVYFHGLHCTGAVDESQAIREGADPPPTKTHTKAITYGTNALISAQGHYKGFKDLPLFAHLQEDCIQQSVEDALHLVEGCIKRLELPPASLKILDDAGSNFALPRANYKRCAVQKSWFHDWKTFQTGKTFPKWENLPNWEDSPKLGKLSQNRKIVCLPKYHGACRGALARLEGRFQTLHRKLLPPIAAPWCFTELDISLSVQLFGPVFIFWTVRSERIMRQAVRKLPRRVEVEACLEGVIIKGLLERHKLGTITMAEDALLACLAIAPATKAKADHKYPKLYGKAERLGHRLNLVKHPNGTPQVLQAPMHLTQRELQAVRPILRTHETLFMPEDEEARQGIPFPQFVCDGKRFTCDDGRERKSESSTLAQDCSSSFVMPEDEEARQGIPFPQFVCDGKRFTCDDGRERKSESSTLAQDCSSSFVILRDNTYCLVHSGLQLVVSEGLVPRFLKVTSFTVEQEGVLAERPTLIRT